MALNDAAYVSLTAGDWRQRREFFGERIASCRLCPHRCGARRLDGEAGQCRLGRLARISSFGLHFGEEPPVSGFRGSGTVFFSGCTLHCVFCQNFPVSQGREGEECTNEVLAGMFLYLQGRGAHNINLVSPTPYLWQIVAALEIGAGRGLRIPIVYNTGGYELAENVRRLHGLIDIYMPDLKYGGGKSSRELAKRLSGVDDYFDHAVTALEEMVRQCGPLQLDGKGIGRRGTIVRHLVLPGHVANSLEVLQALATDSRRGIYLSLMSQYHPAYRATDHADICRCLRPEEYRQVKTRAQELGLSGWFQNV